MAFCWKFCGNMKAVLFGLLLLLFILTETKQSCNYSGNLEIGKNYIVKNPNYPNKTKGEANCRWQIMNYVEINCNVDLPTNTNGCEQQSLSIQFEGKEAQPYCGKGTITIEGMNPIIIFYSSRYSKPSRFFCTIRADKVHGNCSCGKKKPTRIVGGTETGINEYPMMCGLIDSTIKVVYCGCTIISQQHVLTAAHCIKSKNITKIGVVVGEHDVTTGKETKATKVLRVNNCTMHPDYEINKINNDIAVCKIIGALNYSAEVGPVCLPFQHKQDTFVGASVDELGWGLLEFGGPKSTTLQKVELNVTSPTKCEYYYSNELTNTNDIICTRSRGKDSCQMDSGGPVLWQNPKTHNLVSVGIISTGIGCGSDEPAVATRTGAFIDWIMSVTPDVQYCKIE